VKQLLTEGFGPRSRCPCHLPTGLLCVRGYVCPPSRTMVLRLSPKPSRNSRPSTLWFCGSSSTAVGHLSACGCQIWHGRATLTVLTHPAAVMRNNPQPNHRNHCTCWLESSSILPYMQHAQHEPPTAVRLQLYSSLLSVYNAILHCRNISVCQGLACSTHR